MIALNFKRLAFGHQRKLILQLVVFFVLLVLAFFVDLQEAFELHHAAGGAEQIIGVALAFGRNVDGGLVKQCGHHLRGHKAHPDEPVQLQFVFGQQLFQRFRRPQNGSRTNGLVRILRVLFGLINVRRLRHEVLAVALPDKAAHLIQRIFGDAGGIGTHVGNQTDSAFFAQLFSFVQALGQHHGALYAEAQLAG